MRNIFHSMLPSTLSRTVVEAYEGGEEFTGIHDDQKATADKKDIAD